MIQPWHVWIVIALVCIILEIFTAGFAVACFSAGALVAALGCALGLSLIWQVVIFAVVTFLTFMYVRPILIKLFFKKDSGQKTNADALIGRRGRVSVRIDPAKGEGRVAIDGDDWKAVSEDGSTIEKGEEVEVKKIDSIILTVTKI
ncbi:MAG: NfeD family protein [Bacteroidales bacterium]|nr:NfeD family protein [Bacteroidales bacterium]